MKKFMPILLSVMILLLAGCGTPITKATKSVGQDAMTICPHAGLARAAVMPALAAGSHLNIIYALIDAYNPDGNVTMLRRVDISSQKMVEFARMPNADIIETQLSPDGQWVLFTLHISMPHPHYELRLVRVDGQYMQTLFCTLDNSYNKNAANGGHILWSPDEKYVAMVGTAQPYTASSLFLIDITRGKVEQVLSSLERVTQKPVPGTTYPAESESYTTLKWLDKTHLYLMGDIKRAGDYATRKETLYVLDIAQGSNQPFSNLQVVMTLNTNPNGGGTYICDIDNSGDATQLYVSLCNGNGSGKADSTITVQPSYGGTARTLLHSTALAITGIRSVNSQTLLLLVQNFQGDRSQNGLWTMQADGTKLTRLAAADTPDFCGYLQEGPHCSNVSPDGSMYAFTSLNGNDLLYVNTIYYGMVNGGAVHQLNHVGFVVGWVKI